MPKKDTRVRLLERLQAAERRAERAEQEAFRLRGGAPPNATGEEAFLADLWRALGLRHYGKVELTNAELRRLLAIIDHRDDLLADRESDAHHHVLAERWRVVAWLRAKARGWAPGGLCESAVLLAADALEQEGTAEPLPPSRARAEAARLRERVAALEEASAAVVDDAQPLTPDSGSVSNPLLERLAFLLSGAHQR